MSYRTLVDVATLAAHVSDPDWTVIDCRHQLPDPPAGERAYRAGHIPGAHFLHLERDLSRMGGDGLCGGRHPLPDPVTLAARLAGLGVSAASQVVAYDDAGGMIAGRLWWLLRWLGHERVAVLDGGLPAWTAAGLPLNADTPASAAGSLAAATPAASWLRADEVLAGLGLAGRLIVDARSPDRFRGENETLDPVGGHIPGAVNRFFRDNLGPDGRFKPAGQLRSEWAALLGDVPPAAVIHQCGSGVSACHNLLAMEIAGFPGSRLYAGSWSEWCRDPARPVATGSA